MLPRWLQVQATGRLLHKFSLPHGLFHAYRKQGEFATRTSRLHSCVQSAISGSISQPQGSPSPNPLHESIFVSENDPVYDVPLSVIHRPLQSFTEEGKVQEFVRNMQRGDNFAPIEVLWVQQGDDDYYFAFGGCHRWEAHKRLGKQTIKSKLVKTTPKSLSVYLGRNPFKL